MGLRGTFLTTPRASLHPIWNRWGMCGVGCAMLLSWRLTLLLALASLLERNCGGQLMLPESEPGRVLNNNNIKSSAACQELSTSKKERREG